MNSDRRDGTALGVSLVVLRATALSREFGRSIAPGVETLVYKAARGIEDVYEINCLRKDGGRFPALISVTALRDALDEIIGFLLVGTDDVTAMDIAAEERAAFKFGVSAIVGKRDFDGDHFTAEIRRAMSGRETSDRAMATL